MQGPPAELLFQAERHGVPNGRSESTERRAQSTERRPQHSPLPSSQPICGTEAQSSRCSCRRSRRSPRRATTTATPAVTHGDGGDWARRRTHSTAWEMARNKPKQLREQFTRSRMAPAQHGAGCSSV